ncbi:MAG: hypothetical protein KBC96_13225 [Armatimonadetes bacterium]|nr:hypothetical protein [Armatimonadota bacterium]
MRAVIPMMIAISTISGAMAADISEPPKQFTGMLQNGKPFVSTMYYERYYDYPSEYPLMDRDLEDIAARGWTVAYTDYTHLSLGEMWDRYFDSAARLGLMVMPDQWNANYHAGGPFAQRHEPPITEKGAPPTSFCPGCYARWGDPEWAAAMVDYQAQMISRYIDHPAWPRILGPDGKHHPLMLVIYETGMADYNGDWLEYSADTKAKWIEYQKQHVGKILAEEPPKSTDTDKQDVLLLWGEFRAQYIADGWGQVARGLKAKFPGLYAMVAFRQHGLLEGSKSGVNAGGIGRRAIRPELWKDFDVIADEHDGDDGIEFLLADADLMKSASVGRIGALIYYLDSGYKAWTARPVEFHRPWTQGEMLGSMSARGLLPLHYGYNERDDRAGIAATGRREKDAPLWQKKACEDAAVGNKVFLDVAPYLYAAKPAPARSAIVMPYEAYVMRNADEVPVDRRLVRIWQVFHDADVPVEWAFTSSTNIGPYKLLVVPDAPYSDAYRKTLADTEKGGAKVIKLSLDGGEDSGLGELKSALRRMSSALRASRLPVEPGLETALLIGNGYEVDVAVNHWDSPAAVPVTGAGVAYPAERLSSGRLVLPPHSTVWFVRAK